MRFLRRAFVLRIPFKKLTVGVTLFSSQANYCAGVSSASFIDHCLVAVRVGRVDGMINFIVLCLYAIKQRLKLRCIPWCIFGLTAFWAMGNVRNKIPEFDSFCL